MKSWNNGHSKCHLVSEFKDGDTELVCYKYWRPSKQRWEYQVEKKFLLERHVWSQQRVFGGGE